MKLRDYKKNLKNEYRNTFKQKNSKREFHFKFKLRYALLTVAGIILIALIAQHIWVYSYNIGVEEHNQGVNNRVVDIDHSIDLYNINTKEDYNNVVISYQKAYQFKSKKTSILTYLFSFQFIGCTSEKYLPDAPIFSPGDASEDQSNNSFQTNTQVEGIDEADVAKCDGNYIYYLYFFCLISCFVVQALKKYRTFIFFLFFGFFFFFFF